MLKNLVALKGRCVEISMWKQRGRRGGNQCGNEKMGVLRDQCGKEELSVLGNQFGNGLVSSVGNKYGDWENKGVRGWQNVEEYWHWHEMEGKAHRLGRLQIRQCSSGSRIAINGCWGFVGI